MAASGWITVVRRRLRPRAAAAVAPASPDDPAATTTGPRPASAPGGKIHELRAGGGLRATAGHLAARARPHRVFLLLLAVGAALRAVAMLGYRPALWFPDSYTYVVTAMRPRPDLVRPAGYSMFLRLLEPFHGFMVVTAVQHLIGLAVGVLLYVTVLRAGGPRWAAALATVPALLDAYQIQLEHLLVSDSLFALLVLGGVVAASRPPTWRSACAAGLLLAAATLTRTAGLPLIGLVTCWLLARAWTSRRGARRRPVVLAGLALVVALVPVGAYAGWFAATYHRFGIVGSNGVFLYSRTMAFADCAVMRPPADLAVLCDPTPPARRPPSQEYIWSATSPVVALPGITFTESTDRLAGRFASLAIRSQPFDYAASVLGEVARTFVWGRPVYPDREIYGYYQFPAESPPPPGRYPATVGAEFAARYERGPIGTRLVEPFAGVMRAYQDVARLPGTVLLLVMLAPPVVVAVRRRRGGRTGTAWTLPWLGSLALLAIPAATAQFDYRYVLPAVPLACLAAALVARGGEPRRGRPAGSANFE
ncbi:hypothetical protein Skr01_14510 [Sphaerisporangium krabiense]|uniref:ArnT-like N-terminal domain-containing protein n=1 Tax=Sphaerisporangium krabiense TaxID=763782 RepID=A0A7W8YZP7_9ACTN|nr:phospholipid carrier-dependent glycosyltransferase [Sphaerisporangium krabiense]MBB5624677.1 hypothetical protein [Sphaerisporangium krabiense]GII61366.1 hypothetical protein Skr01_14510 [Sphaerisporangium krabiense]